MSNIPDNEKTLIITHKDIYEKFLYLFGFSNDEVDVWTPAGRNSIRARFIDKTFFAAHEIIFTYYSDKYWRLESIKSFFDLV